MRFGHAMVRPTPGLLSDPAWQAAAARARPPVLRALRPERRCRCSRKRSTAACSPPTARCRCCREGRAALRAARRRARSPDAPCRAKAPALPVERAPTYNITMKARRRSILRKSTPGHLLQVVDRLEAAVALAIAHHGGRLASKQPDGRLEVDLRCRVDVERLRGLAEEVRGQVLEHDGHLVGGDDRAAADHAVDHGRPAGARQARGRRAPRLVARAAGPHGDVLARAVRQALAGRHQHHRRAGAGACRADVTAADAIHSATRAPVMSHRTAIAHLRRDQSLVLRARPGRDSTPERGSGEPTTISTGPGRRV